MWSRRLRDAVRSSQQRLFEQERDEKAAVADALRRQAIMESLLSSQVLPAMDRALTEAQVTETLRQGTKTSHNMIVMAGPLKGTTVALRTVTERMACEIYVYHRDKNIQVLRFAKSPDEAYGAICDGFIRVLSSV